MKQLPQCLFHPMRMGTLSMPHSFHPVPHLHEVDPVMVESMCFTDEAAEAQRGLSDLSKITQLGHLSCYKHLCSISPQ